MFNNGSIVPACPSAPAQQRPGFRSASGFTLIELLVVLAIIALLVALLLPALSKAKVYARSIECQSRMRNFHVWIDSYRNDTRWWPVNETWNTGVTSPPGPRPGFYDGRFVDQMKPYMGRMANTSRLVSASQNFFLCPGNNYPPGNHAAATIYANWSNISWGWNLTNYMFSSYFGYGNLPSQPQVWWPKPSQWNLRVSPSKLAIMSEIKSANQHLGYYNWRAPLIYPHIGETANFLMADGHVQSANFATYEAIRLASHIDGEFVFR